jgi:hypothetical protein
MQIPFICFGFHSTVSEQTEGLFRGYASNRQAYESPKRKA